jgi:hypothetical protein
MKAKFINRPPAGFVSYLMVLTTATLLSLLSIYAYRRAMTSHKIESEVQLRVDYTEKEEAVLRSIVSLVPNRAMIAMQPGAAANPTELSWQTIFNQSLAMGNSRASISEELAAQMALPANARRANTGDSQVQANAAIVFSEIDPQNAAQPGLVSAGSAAGRALRADYPPRLNFRGGAAGNVDSANDLLYPIISDSKEYGDLAGGGVGLAPGRTPGAPGTSPATDYSRFNSIPYPKINFGYGVPGEAFVAKRNWWAFSLNMATQDVIGTRMARTARDFVLSIYEIPSQLSISSAANTQLGTNVDGTDWSQDLVRVDGGVFAGRANYAGARNAANATVFDSLASRGGMNVAAGAVVGNERMAQAAMGDREAYQNKMGTPGFGEAMRLGAFYPTSLASDSGRCAFIPISAGNAFYDRYMQPDPTFDKYNPNPAAGSLSSTRWADYTIGARQCAMQLDITGIESAISPGNVNTSAMTFSYLVGGVRVDPVPLGLAPDGIPSFVGYIDVDDRVAVVNCGNTPTNFAWGQPPNNMRTATGQVGNFVFDLGTRPGETPFTAGVTIRRLIQRAFQPVTYPGVVVPFATAPVQKMQVWPERFPAMLSALGADPTSINHSLVVNVNYSGAGPSVPPAPGPVFPGYPPAISDRYDLVLMGCNDLTYFPRGFSLVTNMNLNIAENFNNVNYLPGNLPPGYTPTVTDSNPLGLCFPACSLFAPTQNYGKPDTVLPGVVFRGQRNSTKVDDGIDLPANLVNPVGASQIGAAGEPEIPLANANLTVNLSKIRHPVELPPVNMMNWMVLLEERRREYGQ